VRTYLLATAIAALAIGSSHAETPRITVALPLVKVGCLDIADPERFEPELGRCRFVVPWSSEENGDTPDEAVLYSKDQLGRCHRAGGLGPPRDFAASVGRPLKPSPLSSCTRDSLPCTAASSQCS
jgi:hypothetical protein